MRPGNIIRQYAKILKNQQKATAAVVVVASATTVGLCSCETLTDSRIPNMPVNINLTGHGIWNNFGVDGFGQSRCFILYKSGGEIIREPEDFHWGQTTATGYGGILLISGLNPFTNEVGPLAFDLSCPYERKPTVRVKMVTEPESQQLIARCPVCGSTYNVTERGGSPLSGPSFNDHYQLRMYQCSPPADGSGGYMVMNRR
ncbi:MAG: hypothetical protein NC036_07195 [Muribaculaceae bacterium]|nr:hypothetical protein [Muribaculaceae bacterium]